MNGAKVDEGLLKVRTTVATSEVCCLPEDFVVTQMQVLKSRQVAQIFLECSDCSALTSFKLITLIYVIF